MKRALVTGATGMLGSYIVRRLLANGIGVRALVRNPAAARWLQVAGAEVVSGDLHDRAAIAWGAAKCDAVFHTAATIGPQSEWEPFRTGNVAGTRNVVDACAKTGARLVLISSTAVYGDLRYQLPMVDESLPLPVLPERNAYGRSKQEAERVALDAHLRGYAWCTIIRPPTMYGERDRQFIPRIAVVLDRGLFPLIDGGRTTLAIAHAASVAEGAIAAACSECAGGRAYNLTSDFPLTVADFVRYAGEGLGRRIFTPTLSRRAGLALFHAIAAGVRMVGRPELSAHAIGSFGWLTNDNPYSTDRARRELRWNPSITPNVGVPQAFRWWKSIGTGGNRAERAA
jgi:nucleoside-diphosphate-sugar epimerase